jgi:uncharacterized phage protein (predicted DNA packaging)|nr:MAG TPA: head tail connector [Caudoviricetes sp.]
MRYVTVEDIKKHLYIDFEADDIILADYIDAAQEIIEKYLNVKLCDLVIDERLPYPILQAIKIMTGNLYNNRESVAFNAVPYKVPFSFEFLLQPYKNYKRESEVAQ